MLHCTRVVATSGTMRLLSFVSASATAYFYVAVATNVDYVEYFVYVSSLNIDCMLQFVRMCVCVFVLYMRMNVF